MLGFDFDVGCLVKTFEIGGLGGVYIKKYMF